MDSGLLLDLNLFNSHIGIHHRSLLNGICKSLVVINGVSVRLDGDLLFDPRFNHSILFHFVLQIQYNTINSIQTQKEMTYSDCFYSPCIACG